MTIRVLLADDQEIIRNGLRVILDAQSDIQVVAAVADGRQAIERARYLRPDVCLFDIRMPDIDGVEATRQIAGPAVVDPIPVVIITTFDEDELVHAALHAGASGFLLKDADTELLTRALRAAVDGGSVLDPGVASRLVRRFADGPEQLAMPRFDVLTDREEQVLLTVARGLTNAEIAQELGISVSTVKAHVANLMTKLSARNRVEVAVRAYQTGRL